eukprot:3472521-Amphidinium_carterae.3
MWTSWSLSKKLQAPGSNSHASSASAGDTATSLSMVEVAEEAPKVFCRIRLVIIEENRTELPDLIGCIDTDREGCLDTDRAGCRETDHAGCLDIDRAGCLVTNCAGCLDTDREGCLVADHEGCLATSTQRSEIPLPTAYMECQRADFVTSPHLAVMDTGAANGVIGATQFLIFCQMLQQHGPSPSAHMLTQ